MQLKPYIALLNFVDDNGVETPPSSERTGTGCKSVFGQMMKFDLAQGFPLLGWKKTYFKGVVAELLWFLRGNTNVKELQGQNVHIWDEWADKNGDLGPVYGAMWRNWQGIDQIKILIENLLTDPHSRRHVVSGWNPALLPDPSIPPHKNVSKGLQALPPCHTLWQVHVDVNNKMHLTMYQRSADLFLGVPFNIASYSLLLMMLAHRTGKDLGTFTWMGGDCHIYSSHQKQVEELLLRFVSSPSPKTPRVRLDYPSETALEDVRVEDIILSNYSPYPAILAPVSV